MFPNERAYFAYGSNLHPQRLMGRLGPDIRLLGITQLEDYRIEFSKRSRKDGSAKCTIIPDDGQSVWGAVYAITHSHQEVLDKLEGVGNGYFEQLIMLEVAGARIQGFTYMADREQVDCALKPYCWYKKLVCVGVRHHGFPAAYLAAIESTPFLVDPNEKRRLLNENLLATLG